MIKTKKYHKNSTTLVMFKKQTIRNFLNDCARNGGDAVITPIKFPRNWTRVLRLGPTNKIKPEELLEVTENFPLN